MTELVHGFQSVWIIAVGLEREPGEIAAPVFLFALDLKSQKTVQLGRPKLLQVTHPPYPTGPQSLIVTFDATHLMSLHLVLGWRAPERIVDLAIEFRNLVNGQSCIGGKGLYGALLWNGIPTSPLIGRGTGPTAGPARLAALERLFHAMQPSLDLPRALLRGRYMVAVARIEAQGVPLDKALVDPLTANWRAILRRAAIANDRGTNSRTRRHLLDKLTPVTPDALTVGQDGRNRAPLRPFHTRTGRNQPQAGQWVVAAPRWLRHVVRPQPGHSLALVDWVQQEFGIAAALSADPAMLKAYDSGDPYLDFAVLAGAPEPVEVRDRYKACALGVQNGMGRDALARQAGISKGAAAELLIQHHRTFPQLWTWSDQVEAEALLTGRLQTVFGWRVSVGPDANPRFLRNFPVQANGAEMLRLACCLVTEAGISVCATLHDALLIEAPLSMLDAAIAKTEQAMSEASEIVLHRFRLRTAVQTVPYPETLGDPKDRAIWAFIDEVLGEGIGRARVHQRHASCSPAHARSISLSVSNKRYPYGHR